ncbi:MAG: DUF4157 domain-containing protein [Deltaproteobacteria bacterium]|nr:MAG: DUF4157 domain-containing protein [Deltaproteobacteria bacterium]
MGHARKTRPSEEEVRKKKGAKSSDQSAGPRAGTSNAMLAEQMPANEAEQSPFERLLQMEEEEEAVQASMEEEEETLQMEEEEEAVQASMEEEEETLQMEEEEEAVQASMEEEEETLQASMEEEEETLQASMEEEEETLQMEEEEEAVQASMEEEEETLQMEEEEEAVQASMEEEEETLQASMEEEEETLQMEEEEEAVQASMEEEEETLQMEEEEEAVQASMEEEEETLQASMEEEEETLQMEEEEEEAQMAGDKAKGNRTERRKQRMRNADAGAGEELPAQVRGKFEAAMGVDLSDVRVHTGDKAEAVGAKAFAAGNDLHFNKARYNPGTKEGDELIGHELAHVIQQRAGRVSGFGGSEGMESEAWEVGRKAAAGEEVQVPGAQSQEDEEKKRNGT